MRADVRVHSSWPTRFGLVVLTAWGLGTGRARAEFVHPGVAHSAEGIAFVKARIEANEQPWAGAWAQLSASRPTQLDYRPRPRAHVERGASNNPDIGSSEFGSDAAAAYTHALCWALTGNAAHARKSAEILDSWSGTLESIGNHDARLLVGMSGYKFTVTAELLKHTWDGWPAEWQERFARMAREIWYPIIEDFYPSANGNWRAVRNFVGRIDELTDWKVALDAERIAEIHRLSRP